jgi:hypothetical protein
VARPAQIEPNRAILQAGPSSRDCRTRPAQALALLGGDGLQRPFQRLAALHLHHGENLSANRQKVDFALRRPQPEAEDAVALQHQPGGRQHLGPSAGQAPRHAAGAATGRTLGLARGPHRPFSSMARR